MFKIRVNANVNKYCMSMCACDCESSYLRNMGVTLKNMSYEFLIIILLLLRVAYTDWNLKCQFGWNVNMNLLKDMNNKGLKTLSQLSIFLHNQNIVAYSIPSHHIETADFFKKKQSLCKWLFVMYLVAVVKR